jgi:hypothetical protein
MRTRGGCQSILNQDDRGRRKKTELAMIQEEEGLKNLTKTLSEEEIDSVDSSYMHMSSACEWEREISDSVIGAETQSRRLMARIDDGDTVDSERGEEAVNWRRN